MRLVHFSAEPLGELRFSEQPLEKIRHFGKPEGLWVSDEDDFGWREWCEGEEFGLDRFVHATEIILKPDPGVLMISTPAQLVEFHKTYGRKIQGFDTLELMAWREVASQYTGIIITPYQWSQRLSMMWYYGWDCASGCIWDPAAIETTREYNHAETKEVGQLDSASL